MKIQQTLTRIIAVGILVAVGLITSSHTVQAASGQHITLTPSSTTFSIDPGKAENGSLSVINEGDNGFKVSLSSAPYRVEGLNYDPQFTQLPGTVDAADWVTFTGATNQRVESKKLITIDYTVTVPKGTAPGGYYAVIFAETSPEEPGAGVVAHNRVGNILYITVKGEVTSSGSAKIVAIPPVITGTALKVGAIVSNTGGVHFMTKVSTSIKNLFGNSVYTANTERYVLPSTQREITTDWSPGVPVGIFRIEQTATVPTGEQNLGTQWVFVIQPWVIIALSVIIISIIIIIIRKKKPTS